MAVRCLNKEKAEKSATESNHDAIGQRERGEHGPSEIGKNEINLTPKMCHIFKPPG